MLNVYRPDLSLRKPRHHDLGSTTPRDPICKIVIRVQDNRPFAGNAFGQNRLLPGNSFSTAQKFDMRDPHVGDDRVLRRRDADQSCNFSWVIHTVLKNRYLMLTLESQDGERYPNVIIQVANRFRDAKPFPQYRRHHFFGAGFSVASGNANDGDLKFAAIVLRQSLETS